MSKQVALTEDIVQRMRSVLGQDIDPSNFAVYKCRAISTEPLSKSGSELIDKAVPTENFIRNLSEIANRPEQNVSVHVMHEEFDLAIGRVFSFWEETELSGVKAAYAYMAILKSEENKSVLEKIENGILDEVSIGFEISHGKCSKCGFDFFDNDLSEEDKLEAIWSATCPNGHRMGHDGVHLILDGASKFREISIVNQGAAHRAKIKDESKFSLSDVDKKKAKISLADAACATFLTSLESKMTEEEFDAKYAEMADKLSAMEAKLSALEATAPAEQPKPSEEEEKPAKDGESESESEQEEGEGEAEPAKEANKESEELSAIKAELDSAKADLAKASEELSATKAAFVDEVNKALVAAGKEKVSQETELSAVVKALRDSNITLAAIPVGGRAAPADSEKAGVATCYGFNKNQLKSFKGE